MGTMGTGGPLPWKGVPPKAAGVVMASEYNPQPFGPPPSKEGGIVSPLLDMSNDSY